MRSNRALATAMALVAVVPALAAAQSVRPFKDSWYWGAKAGTFLYSTPSTTNAMAPVGGIDWLITRTKGGLYVSFEQAFFNRIEYIKADGDTTRAVTLKDMRRLDIAAVAFPGSSRFIKPYAGLGFTMQQIANAEPQGTYISPDQQATAESVVTQLRTAWTPLMLAGVQLQMPLISLFAQGTATATQKTSFLRGSNAFNLAGEVGVRFNFGNAIDRN